MSKKPQKSQRTLIQMLLNLNWCTLEISLKMSKTVLFGIKLCVQSREEKLIEYTVYYQYTVEVLVDIITYKSSFKQVSKHFIP